MSAQIALLFCAAFVCVALLVDARRSQNVSPAVWIAVLWAGLLGSRPLTTWFRPETFGDVMLSSEGSALDRSVLIMLMLLAAVVLARRQPPMLRWRREQYWILIFFVFCGLSILWSDFPGVGLKRWVRAIGTLMVILVVASERDPVAATAAVVRRCAIVLLPFSVVLVKYVRTRGIGHNYWTGQEYLLGVATDKNALGRLCLVCGLFALWAILTRANNPHTPRDSLSRWANMGILFVAVWLLFASDSKTSLSCFLVGSLAMVWFGLPIVRKNIRYFGTLTLILVATGVLVSLIFNLPELFVRSLGRDLTLTDRTSVWNDLIAYGTNPFVGVGYDTFWLGDRLEWFATTHQVNEAHNGYLEVYLELGWVGLLLLASILVVAFTRLKQVVSSDTAYGRLLVTTLVVFVFYNITESSYKPTTLISFMLLLVMIASPRLQVEGASSPVKRFGRRPPRQPRLGSRDASVSKGVNSRSRSTRRSPH
jgi:exopolysaccharide production protein ExoQ